MARGIDRNTEWKDNAQDFRTKIGQKLRSRRLELQKSLRDLEPEVGLSRAMISFIERGESDFSVSYLYNFSIALDTSPSDLLAGTLVMEQSRGHAAELGPNEQDTPVQTLKPG